MKNILYWLILILIFSSCKKEYTHNATILKADGLLQFSTNAGYKLLKSMPNPERLNECDYAAWCLQYTRAEYILGKNFKSDSLIRHAVNYYTGSPLMSKAGLAYFLLGKAYENNNEISNAMIAYKTSESYYLPIDHPFLAYLYYDIASLYLSEDNNDKAMINYRKSYFYLHRRKDIYGEAYVYRKIAETMDKQNMKLDSIIHYYKQAQKYALQTKNMENYHDISCNYAITLLQKTKEYEKAKKYFLSAYQFDHYSPYYFNRLAMAYAKLNMPDSAHFYFEKLLADTTTIFDSVSTVYDKKFERGYTLLAAAEAQKVNKKYDSALDYYFKYNTYNDSLKTENKKSKVYKIEQRFDKSVKKREKAELEIANRNKLIALIIVLATVMLMIVQLRLLRIKRRKAYLESLQKKQKLLLSIDNKKQLLLFKLQNRLQSIIQMEALKLKLPKDSQKNSYYQELLNEFVFNADEWIAIISEVNFIHNNFIIRLEEQFYELTRADKIVIALISLELDITDICNILDVSKNTMYRRRNTIKERLGLSSTDDLDKWILAFVGEEDESRNPVE
jgi:tetratricopeptide (TPR) repeat protein